MAQYNMINEIKEIAKIENKELKEVAENLGLDYWDDEEIIAWNRREEGRAKSYLIELKEEIKKEELRKERLSNYHWIKENGNWVVAGNFENKKVEDEIVVMKASGQKDSKIIVRFTEEGNAIVK